MIGIGVFQTVLDAIGSVVAKIYDIIPNYGIAIILLTILVRLILLPLGIKQVRSMHAMQAVQPKVKAIQAKYKNDKQKAQAEIMKVYQEHGVNPLGGCLPLLLQMPVLICLYAVLRFPPPLPAETAGKTLTQEQTQAAMIEALHVPAGSSLQEAITAHDQDWVYGISPGLHFAGANLLCSARDAGKTSAMPLVRGQEQPSIEMDCGSGNGAKIPIYLLILFMVGTTYFQQWQMQRASPPGSAQKQQQMITRVMPLMFLFFFWGYPSGMVLYWSVSNLWQIGQQHFLLKVIKKEQAEAEANGGPPARPGKQAKPGKPDTAAKGAAEPKPVKKGLMQRMVEQAEAQRAAQEEAKKGTKDPKPKPGPRQPPKPSQKKPPAQKPQDPKKPKPEEGS
jgi:YidC/Oxa1 family membrane protein insertase